MRTQYSLVVHYRMTSIVEANREVAAIQQARTAIAAEKRRQEAKGNTAAAARYFTRHKSDVLKRRIEYRIAAWSAMASHCKRSMQSDATQASVHCPWMFSL